MTVKQVVQMLKKGVDVNSQSGFFEERLNDLLFYLLGNFLESVRYRITRQVPGLNPSALLT